MTHTCHTLVHTCCSHYLLQLLLTPLHPQALSGSKQWQEDREENRSKAQLVHCHLPKPSCRDRMAPEDTYRKRINRDCETCNMTYVRTYVGCIIMVSEVISIACIRALMSSCSIHFRPCTVSTAKTHTQRIMPTVGWDGMGWKGPLLYTC